ncbi:hypothetical protein C0995_001514 [Termitomyces sp. Mi166|nr:hypothetical protein C0995_001514 [Termitomyces sp. Mi166\
MREKDACVLLIVPTTVHFLGDGPLVETLEHTDLGIDNPTQTLALGVVPLTMTETIVGTKEGLNLSQIPGIGTCMDGETCLDGVQDPLTAGIEVGRDLPTHIKESPRLEPAAFPNPVKTEEGAITDPVVTKDAGSSQTKTTAHDSEGFHRDKSLAFAPAPPDLTLLKKEEEGVKIPAVQEVKLQADQTLPVAKNESPKGLTSGFADQHRTRPRSPTLPTHSRLSSDQKHISNLPSHLQEPISDKQTREHEKLEEEKSPFVPRTRSPSPPRQPRQRGPPGPIPYPRHRSRSPPKGPRNHPNTHPRGHITPTGPASSHPPGSRGQRRPFAPPTSLPNTLPQPSTPQTQSPITPSLPAPMEDIQPTTAQTPEVVKVPLPSVPIKQLPSSLTEKLDNEASHFSHNVTRAFDQSAIQISRLQSQRTHLATDYMNLAKEIRRALHELDTARIDLHAAELRRKVADAQHEKARNGILGIDYVPTTEARTLT